ncbi:DsbA family protein [Aestuariibius insulae]|uniref:DsbA family protein n=1 Tax=Aestuariibius insulae TaxID=2058287 RepID=UPI00345E22FD
MSGSRRSLLLDGLAVAGAYFLLRDGIPALRSRFASLEFTVLDSPDGFRRIAGGQTSSGGFDPFVGLDANPQGRPDTSEARAAVETDLCGTLFAGWSGDPDVVPIASFSDYNCPICRITTRRLAQLDAVTEGGARITWHELPILGETSLLAARAALAADRQGAYAAFHDRLLRSPFRATPEYLQAVAADLDLDHDRLAADMTSEAVSDRIARSLALRALFSFAGTPAIVIGRTVVEGDVEKATLARLVEMEREEGPPPACSGV